MIYYEFDPSPETLMSGRVHAAIIKRQSRFIAWTRTWEGPARPDRLGALADLREHFQRKMDHADYFYGDECQHDWVPNEVGGATEFCLKCYEIKKVT